MPELPEVETVRRGLKPAMEGARIVKVEQRRADLRFAFPDDFCAALTGRRVEHLGRRAKYLLAELDSAMTLVMHLGMSGSFRIEEAEGADQPGRFRFARSKDAAHDHVVFHLSSKARVVYNDPRRFGFMTIVERAQLAEHPLFAKLGIEPVGNALSGDYLATACAGKTTSLKAALLDQRILAGLGNIYACEALFLARLSPHRRAGTLVRADGTASRRAERLADAVRSVIEEAIEAGGSSLRDHIQADGSLGYFQHRFSVYDREMEPCPRPRCRGIIRRFVQSGRSTFHCPQCQR